MTVAVQVSGRTSCLTSSPLVLITIKYSINQFKHRQPTKEQLERNPLNNFEKFKLIDGILYSDQHQRWTS
jgi:hypothetical protein